MAKRGIGRPSDYKPATGVRLCEEIATGKSIRTVCRELELTISTVYRWFDAYPDFRERYSRAREIQADVLVAQIMDIADDASEDQEIRVREDGSKYTFVDHDHINRSRLRVDSRKWYAAKVLPKRYGERLELAGDKEAPLSVIVTRLDRPPKA